MTAQKVAALNSALPEKKPETAVNGVLVLDHVSVASPVEQGRPRGPHPTIGEVLGKKAATPGPYGTSGSCPRAIPSEGTFSFLTRGERRPARGGRALALTSPLCPPALRLAGTTATLFSNPNALFFSMGTGERTKDPNGGHRATPDGATSHD